MCPKIVKEGAMNRNMKYVSSHLFCESDNYIRYSNDSFIA